MTELTQIQISKETRSRLQAIGRKGESYDQIINRLIDSGNDTRESQGQGEG
ncbi:MAG: hypothetical protein M0Q91_07475 [Methanoregula sp.]|jgi:hypothetical protein|nr:hypothetical protein [Methanoregula sp.]